MLLHFLDDIRLDGRSDELDRFACQARRQTIYECEVQSDYGDEYDGAARNESGVVCVGSH